MNAFSPRYDHALAFAARTHAPQLRKGTQTPYISHVVHVSIILIRHGFSEDIAVAGLLHDVVEDQNVPLADIEQQFGGEVARIVDMLSERKSQNGAELPWEQRKAEKIEHLRTGGPDVAAVKAADAIHNVNSMIADFRAVGPDLWQRFKRGPEQTLGYYRSIQEGVRSWLGDHPIVRELDQAVDSFASMLEGNS